MDRIKKIKILRCGDPHAKVNCLDEMKKLVLFISEQAKLHNVDRIEILGDLTHNHNVVRLEIMEFWLWALDLLSQTHQTVVLIGNHDISGDYRSHFSSLTLFGLMQKPNLIIVDKPLLLGNIGYISYIHDANEFINLSNELSDKGAKVLICHQTIEGSKYESGIYAPDGIPTGSWSERFAHIISGHIHSEQEFGNIIYPGTARWDNVADANKRKGIWIYEHEEDGLISSRKFISTEGVCSPIQFLVWKEEDPEPSMWTKDVRMAVELVGSSVWIAQTKEKLKGKCSIRTKITDSKKCIARKSGNNFEQFLNNFFTSKFNKSDLLNYAKELGIV